MNVKLGKTGKLLIVILVSLIILAIVISVNFLSFSNIGNLIINQIRGKQMIETEYVANQMETHILQVKNELVTLSKFPTMDNSYINKSNINKCSEDITLLHEGIVGKINSLLRVDKEGFVVECSSQDFSNYIGINIKNKDYFKIPKETNEPFVSGIVRQGSSKQIIVSAPLFETTEYTPYPNFAGEFQGVLLSIIDVNMLYNLYINSVINPSNNFFLLVSLSTDETILKSPAIGNYSEIKKYIPEKTIGFNTIIEFNDNGKTIITSSEMIVGSDTWRLIIFTPLKNIGKEITTVQNSLLFTLGFVIIIVIVILLFLISLYKSQQETKEKLDYTLVTLEKLGIKIEIEKDSEKSAEKGVFSQADIILNPRTLYLIKEDEENTAHELFISTLNRGFAGLGIVRDDPRKIKLKYNLQRTSFIWLTNIKVQGIPCETNIDSLFKLIYEFIEKSKKSVVLIDRLDYILTENNFDIVLKKIHALKDLVFTHESIIILSLNPDIVDEQKLKAIQSEAIDLYGKHLAQGAELTEIELSALRFINENNIYNRLVSYKDITEKFNITKPTTRVKIAKLQNMGLLQIDQKGRFKSLKITSTGRKIIR
ncbi:DUF835 domain-containing protein [Candidatus Woesearchaeota archaeon]|nr:DUF835 domain-containing protein [Candidatus Woesearchaeota archaeon]